HPRTWKTFGPGGQELNNGGHGDGKVPNPNLYFNSTTGYFTIQKKDRVFNFTFGNRGGNYPITIPELGSTKCTKVFVYMGQLKGRDVNTQYITNLSLRMFKFQKNDVTKTID
ncbi:phage tail protein, partial [Lactococcus lactis]|nr:phage tail protein [Lactococcus lactis]